MKLNNVSDGQAARLAELCAGFVPPDVEGDRHFHDLTVVEIDHLLDSMTFVFRLGVRLLMGTFNWLTVFILGTPRPFTKLDSTEREHYIDRLENSRFYLIRLLSQITKSLLLMCYYSRDDVERKLGYLNDCVAPTGVSADGGTAS